MFMLKFYRAGGLSEAFSRVGPMRGGVRLVDSVQVGPSTIKPNLRELSISRCTKF